MSPRLALLLVSFAVSLILAPTASSAWNGLPECTPAGPRPCVISVERNGSPVGPSDASYEFWSDHWVDPDGTDHYYFRVIDGTSALSMGETWAVVLNTGAVFPEETFSRSQNMKIDRDVTGGGDHTVRFKVDPVRMAYGGCNSAGSCIPVNPEPTYPAYLDGWVDDLAYVTDPLDRAAMRGFDLASNTDWVSTPLQLDFATNSIILDVANSHFENDGTTVFQGHAEFKLPNAMLTRLYNVDDPGTLTPAAFAVTGAGGAATTTVAINAASVEVVIDGMTFSKRKLRIHGKTQPLRPRELSAERKTSTRGVIRSEGSKRRGSLVRGYQAVCRPGAGATVRAETTQQNKLPIVVNGLTPGKRYVCTVRAKSRAGLGVPGKVAIPRS